MGRALQAVMEGRYKINILKREAHETRAYVLNETKEYAVGINGSGKYFCSCPDRFVHENICKHILMVILAELLGMWKKSTA
ncbi:MAG: SWIM zinc finger family protein [Thermodesulfobacteriota bacterium]